MPSPRITCQEAESGGRPRREFPAAEQRQTEKSVCRLQVNVIKAEIFMQKLCSAEGAEKFRFCDFVTEQARGEFADDVTSDGLLGG